jgi:hypothetical protein
MTVMPYSSRLLTELVTETLSSVVFVADYVQLDFNGPRLSCFVWPVVRKLGNEVRFGDPGYRDVLCSLLMRDVTGAFDSPERGIALEFGDDEIWMKPTAHDLVGVEIAMLQMNNKAREWDIWRPDEGSFQHGDW